MSIKIFKMNKTNSMSSFEIAELTGKRHDVVMGDIRKMLEELGEVAADFSTADFYEADGARHSHKLFNLPRDLVVDLVSSYSYATIALSINDWNWNWCWLKTS